MYLIAGLGNPDKKYSCTRHNIGFDAIDMIAREINCDVKKLKFKSLLGEGKIAGEKVILAKPQTYMNNSGEAIRDISAFYKIEPKNIIIFHDDISLPTGRIRLRPKGSDGGHNGLKNIIQHLGTDAFPRIKVGVGMPDHPDHEMIDWVIGKPQGEEAKTLRAALDHAADAALSVIDEGPDRAMNRFN